MTDDTPMFTTCNSNDAIVVALTAAPFHLVILQTDGSVTGDFIIKVNGGTELNLVVQAGSSTFQGDDFYFTGSVSSIGFLAKFDTNSLILIGFLEVSTANSFGISVTLGISNGYFIVFDQTTDKTVIFDMDLTTFLHTESKEI